MGQRIEQCGLARIGVANQGHCGQRDSLAPLPLLGADALYLLKLAFDVADAPVNLSAVSLKLGFTRSAGADSAPQLRHFNASSAEARKQVFKLRQFHLKLAFT